MGNICLLKTTDKRLSSYETKTGVRLIDGRNVTIEHPLKVEHTGDRRLVFTDESGNGFIIRPKKWEDKLFALERDGKQVSIHGVDVTTKNAYHSFYYI